VNIGHTVKWVLNWLGLLSLPVVVFVGMIAWADYSATGPSWEATVAGLITFAAVLLWLLLVAESIRDWIRTTTSPSHSLLRDSLRVLTATDGGTARPHRLNPSARGLRRPIKWIGWILAVILVAIAVRAVSR
jgi:hypothetical protein